jgi:hypothetical protein
MTKRAVALFPGWPLLGQSGRLRFFLDGRYSDKAGVRAFSWMAVAWTKQAAALFPGWPLLGQSGRLRFSWMAVAWTKRAVALFPGWPLLGQCDVFVLINKSNHQNPSTG